jgi:predicted PurR-regulated permease PerM
MRAGLKWLTSSQMHRFFSTYGSNHSSTPTGPAASGSANAGTDETADAGTLSSLPVWIVVGAAAVWILSTAASVIIAILIALIVAAVLRPLVDRLETLRLPRQVAVVLVLSLGAGITLGAIVGLQDEAIRVINGLPEAVRKARLSVEVQTSQQTGIMQSMRKAGQELDRLSGTVASGLSRQADSSVTPSKWLRDQLIAGSNGAASMLTHAVLILMLIAALLAGGKRARHRFVLAVGKGSQERLRWLRILSDVSAQLQMYVVINAAANVLLGTATWAVLAAIGVEQAWFWGIAAGLMHFIPFIGPLLLAGALGATVIMQGGSAALALTAAGATAAVAFVVGTLILTWLQSRAAKIDTVALLVAMLFLGAFWGVWGLVLAGPVLAIIKSFTAHTSGGSIAAALLEK